VPTADLYSMCGYVTHAWVMSRINGSGSSVQWVTYVMGQVA
jgi:hypothetical protein